MMEILWAVLGTFLLTAAGARWLLQHVTDEGADLTVKMVNRAEVLVRDGRLTMSDRRGVVLDGRPHQSLLAAVHHDLNAGSEVSDV